MLALWVAAGTTPAAESKPLAAATERTVREFFSKYCQDCHGAEKQKGERRFDQLALPVSHPDTVLELQDAIDQLNLGEMPPADAKQRPAEGETRKIVAVLTQLVKEGHATLASTGGRTVLRRLNKREYINSVGDLFGIEMTMFDPTTKFPRDQVVQHMDNIGDALKTSGYLLAQYIDAADSVVEKAFEQTVRPREQRWNFNKDFRQQPELRYSHGKVHNYAYMGLYETITSDKHEGAYGPLLNFAQGVPASGLYEIRVKAEAKFRKNVYAPNFFGTDPTEPFLLGIVAGNAKAGPLHLPQPIEPELADPVPVKDDVQEWYTFRVWLDKGFTPRFVFPNGMLDVRGAYNRTLRVYNKLFPEETRKTTGIVEARVVIMRHGQLPHLRIHEVDIRGPLVGAWPTAGYQTVLGGKPFEAERTRELLTAFATRAYRRPATDEEVERLMGVVDARKKEGRDDFGAFKDGLKAALCSPAFIYLSEPAEKAAESETRLSAHALASRLSYFLWSTTPDAELRRLADSGELLQEEVLVGQARRLLASPRATAFIHGFLDAWLNLRALGDMPPDRGEFRKYYAQNLQTAMKTETRLFMADLIARNESVLRFVDADYTFANRALAKLYGEDNAIDPARAHEFQRIAFSSTQRGGLLGQGSVLTVSANGIETSPVIRGVWVLENILGTPPAPPPDNVPPIDPDIRGAKSMRELLAKHRDNPGCYECHRKIDELGFALESFDPIGAARRTYDKGIKIDTSGELPSGRRFADVAELKKALLERKEPFARMLAERLLTYACGRRIEGLDRPAIDKIVASVAKDDYRMRDLIEAVVTSPTFRSK